MNQENFTKKRWLVIALFTLYLMALVQLVLFKGTVFYEVVPVNNYYKTRTANGSFRIINLQPFRTIKLFLTKSTSFRVMFFNIFGNFLLFVPFGFLIPLVFRIRTGIGRLLLLAFLLSLSFEVYQLVTRTGQFDVDDILLNVSGAIAGFFIHYFLQTHTARKSVAELSQTL
jgi:glycopeptide antibiotics resistance protein